MYKKILVFFAVFVILSSVSLLSSSALEYSELENKIDSLYSTLSEDTQEDLKSIGAYSADLMTLNNVSFRSIFELIVSKVSKESKGPLTSCAVVIAILILNAVIDSYRDTLKVSAMKEVLSVITTLCITSTLVAPVIKLISHCLATVNDASNFMLLYIPIMAAILAFSGHAVTGASYYSFMLLACQCVSQLSTKLVSPLLNIFLGLTVSSSISSKVNLSSLCSMLSKVIKWLIAFIMTVFSALMTIKGMITTAYDSVTARAVRFTMSSFIPIVGAALSESYKTIQGSVNLLRTGAGVFVILAICVVFLPVILQCLIWLLSLNACKTIGEIIGVESPLKLLSSVSSVVSTVFAITVCIMSVFVISTALLITLGGAS